MCVCEVGEGQVRTTGLFSLCSLGDGWLLVLRWDERNKSRFCGRRCVWAKLSARSLRHGQVERSGWSEVSLGPSFLVTPQFALLPRAPELCNKKTWGSAAESGVSSAAPGSGQDPPGL